MKLVESSNVLLLHNFRGCSLYPLFLLFFCKKKHVLAQRWHHNFKTTHSFSKIFSPEESWETFLSSTVTVIANLNTGEYGQHICKKKNGYISRRVFFVIYDTLASLAINKQPLKWSYNGDKSSEWSTITQKKLQREKSFFENWKKSASSWLFWKLKKVVLKCCINQITLTQTQTRLNEDKNLWMSVWVWQ